MSADVLCLRPEADFHEVGVQPPADLAIRFATGPDAVPDDGPGHRPGGGAGVRGPGPGPGLG